MTGTSAENEDAENARHKEKARKHKAARDKIMATKTGEKGLLIVHTGTGSDSYTVTDLFVPARYTFTREFASERRETGPPVEEQPPTSVLDLEARRVPAGGAERRAAHRHAPPHSPEPHVHVDLLGPR